MNQNASKQTGALQNLYSDIEKILAYTEFKDLAAANKAESEESKQYAELWMNAMVSNDNYVTYKNWWTKAMFQEVKPNIKTIEFNEYMEHPFSVPLKFRDLLLERGRDAFLSSYEEKNDYYRMLNGLPPYGTNDYVYLSDDLAEQLHVNDHIPVHELSIYVQNSYMNTDEYRTVLENNPDKGYLKYLGRYKIGIYRARKAYDFDIIRYPTNRSDINPNLLNVFASLYNDYREYVMVVLYNKQLESLYENYRTFMGVLIIAFTLLQIGNKGVEAINDHRFLDDTILHTILSMYGIPDTPLMTKEVRRDLAINLFKLIQEKGTDEVYYHLIQVLGYQDVTISELLLMKGQKFNDDGTPVSSEGSNSYEPYFLQLDLKDKNPYETISSGNAPKYSYEEITENDPMWWNLEDVQDIVNNSPYSESNSKYIVIDSVVHQMQYMFEAIYFARMIMDNHEATDQFFMDIPDLFGTESMSIFDLILYVVCATCVINGLNGTIPGMIPSPDDDQLLAISGFNFDLDMDAFVQYVDTTKYVDKNRLMKYMENLTIQSPTDVSRIFNDVMYPMREWLESKISNSLIRDEFIEYENIYRALFTYDIMRNKFLDNLTEMCETQMLKDLHVSSSDFNTYKEYVNKHDESIIVIYYDNSFNTDIHKGSILLSEILAGIPRSSIIDIFMVHEDDNGYTLDRPAINSALDAIDGLTEFSDPKLPDSILTSGVQKEILKRKLKMSLITKYEDLLELKNNTLYNKLNQGKSLNPDDLENSSWMNDTMTVVLAIESELNSHMKYFEQSVVGEQLFFKPLITLIKYFKSVLVDVVKTGLKYEFDDKMDSGGYSNMFKFFDIMQFLIHFSTIGGSGYDSQFGFYDTEHTMKHHIIMKDRSEMLKMIVGSGFAAEERKTRMGSIRMVDECKFFKNGKPVDPSGHYSAWYVGEPGVGRWSEEDDRLVRTRTSVERVQTAPVDLEGWKDFVESYNG